MFFVGGLTFECRAAYGRVCCQEISSTSSLCANRFTASEWLQRRCTTTIYAYANAKLHRHIGVVVVVVVFWPEVWAWQHGRNLILGAVSCALYIYSIYNKWLIINRLISVVFVQPPLQQSILRSHPRNMRSVMSNNNVAFY